MVALLGRNGAGKSTTFRSIVGLVAQRSGRIVFEGRDVSREPTHAIVRGGLGYVPEERRIFTDLTVEENLEVGRQPKRTNAPYWTHEKLFALFPNLGEMRNRPGGRMSGGEQQMLTIARTLMGNPSLVLLDEPSEGLSPKIVEQMVDAILTMKKEGVSIVVSEQNLHFARLISDRAYIIERGRICFGGTMARTRRAAGHPRRASVVVTRSEGRERWPGALAETKRKAVETVLHPRRADRFHPSPGLAAPRRDLCPRDRHQPDADAMGGAGKTDRDRPVFAESAGRLTSMDVATIKGVIDRLTARGLTETSSDPEDGRRLLVSLTRAGQQLAEKAAPNALAITRETLAPLDAKERETLMGLLGKLR